MKRFFALLFIGGVLFGPIVAAVAQSTMTVDQGKPGRYGAWNVTTSASTPVYANTAAQTTAAQVELLVLTASTAVPLTVGQRSIEIQNLGPNPIFCNANGAAVLNKSRRIDPFNSWTLDANDTALANFACIAATANQVTGAASIVTRLQ